MDDDEQTYEVEKILDHRGEGMAREYFIRWKGWAEQYDEWLPKASCNCPDLINAYWESRPEKAQRKRGRSRKNTNMKAGSSSLSESAPEPAGIAEEMTDFFVGVNPQRHTKVDPINYNDAKGLITPEKVDVRKTHTKKRKRTSSFRDEDRETLKTKSGKREESQSEISKPAAEVMDTSSDILLDIEPLANDAEDIHETERKEGEIMDDSVTESLPEAASIAQSTPFYENVYTADGIVDTKLLYAHIEHEHDMAAKRIRHLGGFKKHPFVQFPTAKDRQCSVVDFSDWLKDVTTTRFHMGLNKK